MKKIRNCFLAFAMLSLMFACGSAKKATSDIGDFPEVPLREIDQSEYLKFERLDPNDFDENSIVIDNKYWPMIPGTEKAYKGHDIDEDGEKIEHSILSTVTDLTKVIKGVNCVVLYERDYGPDGLEDTEIGFYAQDKYGNVWHLGAAMEYIEEGTVKSGLAWAHEYGDGLRAGIFMPAKPSVDDRSYCISFGPYPYNMSDRFKVFKTGINYSNEFGEYTDVIVNEEFARYETGFQLKYYAPNVGLVGVGYRGPDKAQEVMPLAEVRTLDKNAMDKIREESYAIETRALLYGATPRLQVRGSGVSNK